MDQTELPKGTISPQYSRSNSPSSPRRGSQQSTKINVKPSTVGDVFKTLNLNLSSIAKSSECDLDLNEKQTENLLLWVVYSVLNGPVGKGKFIETGDKKIEGKDLSFISNTQIFVLCNKVKELIPKGINCIMYEKYGDYYPNDKFLEGHKTILQTK